MKLSKKVRRDIDAAFKRYMEENPFDPNGSLDGYMLAMWRSGVHTGMNMRKKRDIELDMGTAPVTVIAVRRRRSIEP